MSDYKTCPNANCRNNATEFDFESNYCDQCGTELVIIDDDNDYEEDEEEEVS
jgi:hypothetical protein